MIKSSANWKLHPQFAERDIKLKEHLEKFNKNLIKSKNFKFERDRSAFAEGPAFRWLAPKWHPAYRTF